MRCDGSRHNANHRPLMAMEQYLYLIPLLPLSGLCDDLLRRLLLRTAAHWIATPVGCPCSRCRYTGRSAPQEGACGRISTPGSSPVVSISGSIFSSTS